MIYEDKPYTPIVNQETCPKCGKPTDECTCGEEEGEGEGSEE